MNYYNKIKNLLNEQYNEWQVLKQGIDSLKTLKHKIFKINNYQISIQHNPGRAISTFAKTDSKSITGRKCFLCKENLPSEERGICWKNNFTIYPNPFPILDEHIVIANDFHIPQLFENNIENFVLLVRDIGENLIVIYNGPECGASAPDHLHFQAFNKKNFITEKDFISSEKFNEKIILGSNRDFEISYIENYSRYILKLEMSESDKCIETVSGIFQVLKKFYNGRIEPMLNFAGFFDNGKFKIYFILRDKHRPEEFFRNDDKHIGISPASIDLISSVVVPSVKDFEKITVSDIKNIFEQITMENNRFYNFIGELKCIY